MRADVGVGYTLSLGIGAGKDGNIYEVSRIGSALGEYTDGSVDNNFMTLTGALPNGASSSPAYFNGTIYYAGINDSLKAFSLQSYSTMPLSQSSTIYGSSGATPVISANGGQDAIVWVLDNGQGTPAVLHAYDASDLTRELYNSNQATGSRDSFGTDQRFSTPVVEKGKVYIGTQNGVAVFGLLQ